MRFSDLASIRKRVVSPSQFNRFSIYLGFEHLDPGALRVNSYGDPSAVTSTKQAFFPSDTIYGKLRPYFRKVIFVEGITGICSTDFWVFQPKPGVDPRFLFYVAASQEFSDTATSSSEGTRMPRASWSVVKDFEVRDMSSHEQRAIAATLGALDDKIESNRRAILKLDQLFHLTWRKFYDGRECSDNHKLAEHVETQYGLTASATDDPAGIKFLRVTDINKTNWIEWKSVPTVSADAANVKYLLQRGDLVVARMADPGKTAIYDDNDISAVFASYLVRLKPFSYEAGLFIYGFLKSADYCDYAAGAMTGSVQKNMNARVIVDVSLRWPNPSALSEFASSVVPLRNLLIAKVKENGQLAALRDTLLPELLSGRIRVSEAA